MARQNVKTLARAAGITLPEEREEALVAGFEVSQTIADTLSRLEYGETEPAARFSPPVPRR